MKCLLERMETKDIFYKQEDFGKTQSLKWQVVVKVMKVKTRRGCNSNAAKIKDTACIKEEQTMILWF